MERIEKTVFLSYRRTNIPWALAIFQNLTQNGYDVFFDYNGIASGDFESVILGNITARAHFLVLLTPSALERCDDPADWLRREIETALANQRNIVPLMLEGFDFGTPTIASQLTGTLAALKRYNGLSIPPEYFLEAMERLRGRYLNVPLTAVLHPASLPVQRAATEQRAAAGSSRTMPTPSPIGARCAATKATWRARCRTTTRPSGSSLTMPRPSTTGASRAAPTATWMVRCKTTTKPSGSSRTLPSPSTTGALRAALMATWKARGKITTKPSGSDTNRKGKRARPAPSFFTARTDLCDTQIVKGSEFLRKLQWLARRRGLRTKRDRLF